MGLRTCEEFLTTRARRVLAYHDADFLASDEARPLRIMAEYLQPLRAFREAQVSETVVFFGSARLRADGPNGRYFEALVRHGVIAPEDLELFSFVDTPGEALARLQKGIVLEPATTAPARPVFAKSRHPSESAGS